jgi:hypothetical protein
MPENETLQPGAKPLPLRSAPPLGALFICTGLRGLLPFRCRGAVVVVVPHRACTVVLSIELQNFVKEADKTTSRATQELSPSSPSSSSFQISTADLIRSLTLASHDRVTTHHCPEVELRRTRLCSPSLAFHTLGLQDIACSEIIITENSLTSISAKLLD